MQQQPLSLPEALKFTLAGRAVFTVKSRRTGKRFTFKVNKKENGTIFFVSFLRGPNNDVGDFSYLGIIRDSTMEFSFTKNSAAKEDASVAQAWVWVWDAVCGQDEGKFNTFEFWHMGKCGRCGRALTDPDSIRLGLGPICATID